MKEIFLATSKNNYSPKIFESKYLAALVLLLAIFNILSPAIPSLTNKVYAQSISASELISMANQTRKSLGLSELSQNSKLVSAAKAKAEDMLAKNYWSHYGPNGETPWQFIKGTGYTYVYAGENLAKGFVSSTGVHEAWLNSSTHRANIVKPEFKDIGIYVVDGTLLGEQTTLVVQMFGTPTNTTTTNPTTSKSSSSAIAKKVVTTKDNSAPAKPVLTSPTTNQYLNTLSIKLNGTVEKNSNVNIYVDDNKLETVNSPSTNFEHTLKTLAEGEHKIEIESVDQAGNISPKSDSVMVILDVTPPTILEEYSIVSKEGDKYIFTITINQQEQIKEVSASIAGVVVNSNSIPYTVSLSEEQLKSENIILIATDLAGNKSENVLNTKVLGQTITNYEKENLPTKEISSTQQLKDALSPLTDLSIRQKVNIALASFLIFLMILDLLVLFRLKIFHPERTHSAFHLPQFVLVLMLLIFSGLGSIK